MSFWCNNKIIIIRIIFLVFLFSTEKGRFFHCYIKKNYRDKTFVSIQETFFFCEGLSLECYKTSHTGAGSDLVQCSEEEDTCIISGLSGNNKAKLADNRDKPRNLEITCVHQKDQNWE